MKLMPMHGIGLVALAAAVGAGIYFYSKHKGGKTTTHDIAVFKQNTEQLGDDYDKLGGFNVRDYSGESPVYGMRTKQPNGIINTTTWWENSNTSDAFDLPSRDTQMPLSGYIQTSPQP
jgi:hypothetical protein